MSKTKIIFDKESVVGNFMKAINIIPSKPLTPINEFYMFDVVNNVCTVYASDSNMMLSFSTEVDATSDAKFCLPAQIFTDTIKLLREPTFTLTLLDKACQISSGKSKYKLFTEDPNYFSIIHEGQHTSELSMRGEILKHAMTSAVSFINKKTDNQLRAINLSSHNNKFQIIGGQTMLLSKHKLKPNSMTSFNQVNLYPQTAKVIQDIFNDNDIIDIFHDEHCVTFASEKIKLVATASTVKYPKSEQLFKKDGKNFFRISPSYLLDALRRIILYAEDRVFGAVFHISKDSLMITSQNDALNTSGEEVMEISSDQELQIAIPANQAIQILESLNEQNILNTELIRIYMGENHKMMLMFTEDMDDNCKEFLISPIMINKK